MYTICFKYPYSILLCYRALEVLDLFFNFIFNIRLEVSVPLITLQQNSELLLTFIVLTVLVLLSFFCNMVVGAKGLITKYRYVLLEGKYPILNYIDNGHFIKKNAINSWRLYIQKTTNYLYIEVIYRSPQSWVVVKKCQRNI